MPIRYRELIERRPELLRFADRVRYKRDEYQALDCADGVVIAQRPADQPVWVARALARPAVKRLILEKPLAPSPAEAFNLLDTLSKSARAFRIGYVFRHTYWGSRFIRDARAYVTPGGALRVTWSFMAHHYSRDLRNWKRLSASGGGAVRFYGIQLIALLAEIGYSEVLTSLVRGDSKDDINLWAATLTGPTLPACDLTVDCRSSVSRFLLERTINGATTALVNAVDPLTEPERAAAIRLDSDRRVPIVGRLCQSLRNESDQSYSWYRDVIRLWDRIEQASEFTGITAPSSTIAS